MKTLIAIMLCGLLFAPTTAAYGENTSASFRIGQIDRPLRLGVFGRESLQRAIDLTPSLSLQSKPTESQPEQRSWIGRHPVLFGTVVGFGAGFAVGYPGGRASARNDPSSDYFTPEEAGLFVGGIGAGAGAIVGWAVSRGR